MKDFYDLSKMERVLHPLQAKIDSGELKLRSVFDISDEEFNAKLQRLDEDEREYALEMRQQWKEEQLLKEISQVEKACNSQLPSEVIALLEKIKNHLSQNEFKGAANI